MRYLRIWFIAFLILLSPVWAQKVQNFNGNSNSPVLQKEARVVEIKKVFTIDGNSEFYNFKGPWNFKIAGDGTVFIIDQNKSLYRFSASGKYLGNLFEKGEGPGELIFIHDYYLGGNSVIQSFRNKIVIKDFQGKYKKDFKIPLKGSLRLIGFEGTTYYLTRTDSFSFKNIHNGKEIKDMSHTHFFYSWGLCDTNARKSNIKYKEFMRKKSFKGGGATIIHSPLNAFVLSNVRNGSFYFCNSFDYKIKKIIISNLSEKQEFGRPFSKVKHFFSESYIKQMKRMTIPIKKNEIKYFKAVLKLINQGEELWVITSTVKKDKGVLVDVFSKDGVYKDKFFLPVPEITNPHLPEFNIIDDKIIVLGKDEDENHVINLYKIKER